MITIERNLNEKIETYVKQGGLLWLDKDSDLFSKEELNYYQKLYFMYEFSDNVRLKQKYEQFGGLHNYVITGILTEEEMQKAIVL